MEINIVNKHTHKPTSNDYYIGRGSPVGNPYIIGKDGTREEVIEKYKQLWQTNLEHFILFDTPFSTYLQQIYKHLKSVGVVNLVCFCSPNSCHGDIIKEALLKQLENEKL